MCIQFFYKDGQGHVADKHGVKPMDLVINEGLSPIESISPGT